MSEEGVSERLSRFDVEIREGLMRDADNRIAGFAVEYNIKPGLVRAALPRLYVQVGIEVELRRAGCSDEVIRNASHHAMMLLNGVKECSGTKSKGDDER